MSHIMGYELKKNIYQYTAKNVEPKVTLTHKVEKPMSRKKNGQELLKLLGVLQE